MAKEKITDEGVTITIDTDAIEADLFAALLAYSQLLEGQFTKEIGTRQFEWPTDTMRGAYNKKSRETIQAGRRDIVDTGMFRSSIQRSSLQAGAKYRFTWNVPYSAAILKGYRTGRGNQMPARDWITPALKKLPPLRTMKRLLAPKG